jgi:methyl-accepting chemotaxis protein
MKNLTIQHRLICLMAIGIVSTLVVAVLALANNREARDATAVLTEITSAVRHSMNADMMHDAIRADAYAIRLAWSSSDKNALEAAAKELDSHALEMARSIKEASENGLPQATAKVVADALPAVQNYMDKAKALPEAVKVADGADAAVAAFEKAFEDTEAALEKSGDAIESAAATLQADIQAQLARGQVVTLAAIVVCVGLVAVVSFFVMGSIMTPLGNLRAAVLNLNSNDGDLSRRLPQAVAEFGEVSTLFNCFLDKVARVVGGVQMSAQQISMTSAQIASGNMDLSQRTEQTSVSLQSAASSMEQITATVKQSTDSARQATALAVSASEVAAKGGKAVSRVVATMEEINVASKKISDITVVIDSIAFQTNILALNAAVEAARAGEQGRGFAVVAGEVRILAQRSAEAAKEIKTLIGTSVNRVETGSQLVRDAGTTMDEIVTSVRRVSHMIQEITHAAAEQGAGIMVVNETVTQLDSNTQQNTALVQETASVAKALAHQAQVLEQTVGAFKPVHTDASTGFVLADQ